MDMNLFMMDLIEKGMDAGEPSKKRQELAAVFRMLQKSSIRDINWGDQTMALFEGFDRRIKQITSTLEEYHIPSLKAAETMCKEKGLDVYRIARDATHLF